MKELQRKLETQNIEEIERAAWYARLAFGIDQEITRNTSAKPEKPEPTFHVMP